MYNKYGNRKTIIDNHVFPSKKEATRYSELKLLERAGKISRLELQPKFELQEKFKHPVWGAQRAIAYVADFLYIEDSRQVVEDVKGAKTAIYLLKKKMLLYKYPLIDFREV